MGLCNGAVAQPSVQTYTRPSGNGEYTTAGGETLLDDTCKDTRVQLSGQWTQPVIQDMRVSGGFNVSNEYAVNKVAQIMTSSVPKISILVNFEGDIQVTRRRTTHPYWQIGIENPAESSSAAVVNIAHGGTATSGDANRFLVSQGKRHSHILNPQSGYPVADAPRSLTMASEHCI